MKFSTTLALGLAPVALARQVRDVYPHSRRDGHLKGAEQPVEQVHEQPVEQVHEQPVEQPIEKGHEAVQQAPAVHEPPKQGHVEVDPKKWEAEEQKAQEHGFVAGHKEQIILIWAEEPQKERVQYHEAVTVTETVTEQGNKHEPTEAPVHPPEAAQTHTVVVGGPDGLIFQPEELEVPMGDMIVFEFLAMNHTVTQATFDEPCVPMEGGMDSGHQPNPDNEQPAPQVAMQVTTGDPLWFYCKTGNHCGQGMVFSVNPTAENTHDKFKEKAIATEGDGADTPIVGGESPAESPEAPAESPEAPAESPEAPAVDAPEAPAPTPDVGGGQQGTKPGQGVVGADGACHCMVACDMGAAWPAAGQQGVGHLGGMSGSLDMGAIGLRRRV